MNYCHIYTLLLITLFSSLLGDVSSLSFSESWSALSYSDVKPFYGCEKNAYPPNDSDRVPRYNVNLDLQPKQRWTNIVYEKKADLVGLIDYVYNFTESLLGKTVFTYLLNHTDAIVVTLPHVYQEELKGISEASGLTVEEVTMYNIFYELFTFCTSIIIKDSQGDIYHGRNLDFGLFLGWNSSSKEWKVAEKLRPLIIDLEWTRGNSTVFTSASFVGYIGVITGVKPGAFSLSINERFSLNGGYVGLLEWIMFEDHDQQWLAFLTREVLESSSTYSEAVSRLQTPRLLAPVYFVVAGIKQGEGCIITRYRDAHKTKSLKDSPEGWYLVQTNYDYWNAPPFYDDRRTPAIKCLLQSKGNDTREKRVKTWSQVVSKLANTVKSTVGNMLDYVGIDNLLSSNTIIGGAPVDYDSSVSLLYNVLSTRPVLNKLTTYTSVMSAKRGELKTYLRYCADPCWPW